jgi:hypothetical protein
MSLTPEPSLPETQPPGPPPRETQPRETQKVWPKRLLQVSLALFTFEIGLFLVIFPWTDYWSFNYFQAVIPALQDAWNQPAFRASLSVLGLLNVYLACLQVVNAFRRR